MKFLLSSSYVRKIVRQMFANNVAITQTRMTIDSPKSKDDKEFYFIYKNMDEQLCCWNCNNPKTGTWKRLHFSALFGRREFIFPGIRSDRSSSEPFPFEIHICLGTRCRCKEKLTSDFFCRRFCFFINSFVIALHTIAHSTSNNTS